MSFRPNQAAIQLALIVSFTVTSISACFAQGYAIPPTQPNVASTVSESAADAIGAAKYPQPLEIPAPAPTIAAPEIASSSQVSGINLDVAGDQIGIAQSKAHSMGLQARILWIDATANLASTNNADKIDAIAKQAKQAGFNTIVMDVKPIIGYTLYPSKFAPKLTDWKGTSLPLDFDPLAAMIQACHLRGLKLIANISTFGEGHKIVNSGLALSTFPSWQTTLYEATRTVTSKVVGAGPITIADSPNQLPTDEAQIAYFSDPSLIKRNLPDGTIEVVDFLGRVIAKIDGSAAKYVTLRTPPQGAILVGIGSAGDLLRTQTDVGDILTYNSIPKYVPISQAQEQKVTVFVNPNNPDVQQHELDIVGEIAHNYDIDGIIFDDRLRFAAINADFSELSKRQFEEYVGRKLSWPDDIFRISPYPGQDIIKGPYFEAWTVWRALTIRNWLAKARALVKQIKPNATVSVYAGSWYGDYWQYGSNWAADDFAGPFAFLTPSFQKTGFAGLLDWMTTGCYYSDSTILDGASDNQPGASVEAAGQLTNRAVNDQTWCYAGLYVQLFDGKPEQFSRAILAATASTQGVMFFDLSQINQFNLWPQITQAFSQPTQSPHSVPGLLDTVRKQHFADIKNGVQLPPVVVYSGISGTGL